MKAASADDKNETRGSGQKEKNTSGFEDFCVFKADFFCNFPGKKVACKCTDKWNQK